MRPLIRGDDADGLAGLGARELGALFGARTVSPREATRSVLDRVEALDPALNAFVSVDAAGALAAAEASEQRYLRGEARGPLDGVTFTVKDVLAVAGLPTRRGSRLTGTTPADRLPVRAGVGSAVAALRPAAQASAASLAGDGGTGARRGFGARATDLSTNSFSGSAVTAQERVSTATLHKRPAAASADD